MEAAPHDAKKAKKRGQPRTQWMKKKKGAKKGIRVREDDILGRLKNDDIDGVRA